MPWARPAPNRTIAAIMAIMLKRFIEILPAAAGYLLMVFTTMSMPKGVLSCPLKK